MRLLRPSGFPSHRRRWFGLIRCYNVIHYLNLCQAKYNINRISFCLEGFTNQRRMGKAHFSAVTVISQETYRDKVTLRNAGFCLILTDIFALAECCDNRTNTFTSR